MHDEQELATASTRRLPPEALAGLREAFAAELAERLPRLRQAVDSGDDVLLRQAVRDAHSLGSSAAVVGEADASRTARALEAELGIDAPDRERCAALVRELADHLGAWVPA